MPHPAQALPVELLTYHEAMATLRCSSATLARLVAAGELPSVKIGRNRRFDAADVRAFVDRNRVTERLFNGQPTDVDEQVTA